ncbi:dihydroorotase, partial [Roseomonas sp. DSM 102946]|nr:dihydroorotase [Roseomonas sp. DSM 102946]
MTDTIFTNVRLLDPAGGLDVAGGLLVRDGTIAEVLQGGPAGIPEGATVVDGGGACLAPGLIDLRAA